MKILMITASRNFRDEEYLKLKEIFDREKFQITTASTTVGQIRGFLGTWIKSDCQLIEIKTNNFDAVVFVGGNGAVEYFNNKTALKIAKELFDAGKVVSAICIAPSILANTGILSGKRVTAYPSEKDNITLKGAVFIDEGVVCDENIITARGPDNAEEFGEMIVRKLREKGK